MPRTLPASSGPSASTETSSDGARRNSPAARSRLQLPARWPRALLIWPSRLTSPFQSPRRRPGAGCGFAYLDMTLPWSVT